MMRSTTGWRCRLIVCPGSAHFLYGACNLCVNGLIFLLSYRLNKIWKSPWRREFSLMKARESGPRGSGIFFFLWNNNPSFVFVLFVPLWHFNNRGQYPNCKQLTKTTYCLSLGGQTPGHGKPVGSFVLCFSFSTVFWFSLSCAVPDWASRLDFLFCPVLLPSPGQSWEHALINTLKQQVPGCSSSWYSSLRHRHLEEF